MEKSATSPNLRCFQASVNPGKRNRGTVDFSFVIVPPFLLSFCSISESYFCNFSDDFHSIIRYHPTKSQPIDQPSRRPNHIVLVSTDCGTESCSSL